MNVVLTDEQAEVGSCVYKLTVSGKYLIVKAKSLESSLFFIDKGFQAFLMRGGQRRGMVNCGKGQKEGDTNNTFYMPLYKLLKKNVNAPVSVEILLESDDAFELLKCEHEALNLAIRDKKCINTNVKAYIPVFNEKTQMYNWISKEDVDKFKYWRDYPYV